MKMKGERTMTTYTENGNITTKTEFEEIGWSLLDASTIYRATVTEFSIAEGIIRIYTKVVNSDGSDYKPAYYRNHCNGFSATADEQKTLTNSRVTPE